MKSFQINHDENLIVILHIKDNINQSNFYVKVPLSISGHDLKKEIESQNENLEYQNMRLVFNGKLLSDYFSLYHQGIKNSSVIYLIPQKVQKIEDNETLETPLNNNKSSTKQRLRVFQVSQTCVRAKTVELYLKSSIFKLDGVFTTNTLYIYHGTILDKTKTFEYYNIINESTIIILPADLAKANPSFLEKWIKITNDSDGFQLMIDSKAKKSCIRESSRLIDISYNNLELKRKAYFSVFNENRINRNIPNYPNEIPQSNVDYPSKISDTPFEV